MTPLVDQDYEVAKWVADKLGHWIEPPFTAIGFQDETGLKAGAVFYEYVPEGNIEIALATERGITRQMLRLFANYAFEQLGCARISARTKQSNKRVCGLVKRLGFVREATLKDYYGPGENAELFRMLKSDCRWL